MKKGKTNAGMGKTKTTASANAGPMRGTTDVAKPTATPSKGMKGGQRKPVKC